MQMARSHAGMKEIDSLGSRRRIDLSRIVSDEGCNELYFRWALRVSVLVDAPSSLLYRALWPKGIDGSVFFVGGDVSWSVGVRSIRLLDGRDSI